MIDYGDLGDESLDDLRAIYETGLENHRKGKVNYPCGVSPTRIKKWLHGVKAEQKRRKEVRMSNTVLVKCASHRARHKLTALVGEKNMTAFFSFRRNTGKGVFRIPEAQVDAAKAITGVSGMRDGDDLIRCWDQL